MSGEDIKRAGTPAAADETKSSSATGQVRVQEVEVRPSAVTSGSSTSNKSLSITTPRTARFAEATSVNSPTSPSRRNPFTGPSIDTTHVVAEPQIADVGFGYMPSSAAIKHTSVEMPLTPREPLKSAMKSPSGTLKAPGTPGRFLDPRSPTFKEEVALEKQELKTDKDNAADMKVKKRVRIAKFFLRGVNFSCSLIILSMLSATFTIFNATKALPQRSGMFAWAPGQQTWPQITLLCIACVSLAICLLVFWGYWRGGHRRAGKAAFYHTAFSIGIFTFSTIMWVFAAAMFHASKANGNGQDMWGWSCASNKRSGIFQDEVNYTLLCRLQNWSLICIIIEVTVEVFSIIIYSILLYRFISKRKLHKTMDARDKARSDLYLAQLRMQSAPNTPGLPQHREAAAAAAAANGGKTPMGATFGKNVHDSDSDSDDGAEVAEKGARKDAADREYEQRFNDFQMRVTPPPEPAPAGSSAAPAEPTVNDHVPAAPGEQQYAAVPIPGAYASPLTSPSYAPMQATQFQGR